MLVGVFNGVSSGLAWWNGASVIPLGYTGLPIQKGAADQGIAVVEVPRSLTPATFPPQGWPAFPLRNFDWSDGWLAGWNDTHNGVALWQAGPSPLGYVLSENVDRFAVGVAAQANGHVLVVASTGAGQLPGELVTYDVDPVAQTVNGVHVVLRDLSHATPIPPDPPVPPIPPIPPVPVEDDAMFTIYAANLERFFEDPTKWVLRGQDGRYLQVNFEWDIIWRAGTNHAGPDKIESDSAIDWVKGAATATMVRNGCTRRVFPVQN